MAALTAGSHLAGLLLLTWLGMRTVQLPRPAEPRFVTARGEAAPEFIAARAHRTGVPGTSSKSRRLFCGFFQWVREGRSIESIEMPLVLLVALPFIASVLAASLPSDARNRESTLAGVVALFGAVQVAWMFPQAWPMATCCARPTNGSRHSA